MRSFTYRVWKAWGHSDGAAMAPALGQHTSKGRSVSTFVSREGRANISLCRAVSCHDALEVPILAILQHSLTWLLSVLKQSS